MYKNKNANNLALQRLHFLRMSHVTSKASDRRGGVQKKLRRGIALRLRDALNGLITWDQVLFI